MKNVQKGFTLIELMIVIAIIGILAAIALPAYQDYLARSQAAEGFKATSGLQTDIGVFYAENNRFPVATDFTAATGTAKGIKSVAENLEGKYMGDVGVAADGVIVVGYDTGANVGKWMILEPSAVSTTGQIAKWKCAGEGVTTVPTTITTAAVAGVGLEYRRMPSSCQ